VHRCILGLIRPTCDQVLQLQYSARCVCYAAVCYNVGGIRWKLAIRLRFEKLLPWWSGVVVSAIASINEVNQRRARLVLRWVTVSGSIAGAGHLFRYVTSHPCQLNLTIPSCVGAMSTSQRAVTPCSWGLKAGMGRVCVGGR